MPISIRIANPPESLVKEFSKSQARFYYKYAKMVSEIIGFPMIQKFLQFIMSKEGINVTTIRDVRIMVFPSGRKMGKDKTIAGTYNEKKRQISVYPLVGIGNK